MKKCLLSFIGLAFVLIGRSQSWNINGNAGTNPAVHFLGTTDNNALRFRVNNQYAGGIDSVNGNSSFGYGAAKNIKTGTYNTATGFKSLGSDTSGSYNTAHG